MKTIKETEEKMFKLRELRPLTKEEIKLKAHKKALQQVVGLINEFVKQYPELIVMMELLKSKIKGDASYSTKGVKKVKFYDHEKDEWCKEDTNYERVKKLMNDCKERTLSEVAEKLDIFPIEVKEVFNQLDKEYFWEDAISKRRRIRLSPQNNYFTKENDSANENDCETCGIGIEKGERLCDGCKDYLNQNESEMGDENEQRRV